jgi:hypothetical protein
MIRRRVLPFALVLWLAACQSLPNPDIGGEPLFANPAAGHAARGALAPGMARLTFARDDGDGFAFQTPDVRINRTAIASLAPGERQSRDVPAGAVAFEVGVWRAPAQTAVALTAEPGVEYVYRVAADDDGAAARAMASGALVIGVFTAIIRDPHSPAGHALPPAGARFKATLGETRRHAAL